MQILKAFNHHGIAKQTKKHLSIHFNLANCIARILILEISTLSSWLMIPRDIVNKTYSRLSKLDSLVVQVYFSLYM